MEPLSSVRALLEQDPYWSLYALGDLDPQRVCHARFFAAPPHIGLLYEQFEIPILFALGDAGVLFRTMPLPDRCYLQVQADALAYIERSHTVSPLRPALRMRLENQRFQPVPSPDCRRLTIEDLPQIERLYADGEATGESPDFFYPLMVQEGVFVGRYVDGSLVSVAGTHLLGETAAVAAIGNVYTHRGYRRRGYAAETTSAVASLLIESGFHRIGLNVYTGNAGAQRVYRELGFVEHCRYFEGLAVRRSSEPLTGTKNTPFEG